jgi:hypothetical protein
MPPIYSPRRLHDVLRHEIDSILMDLKHSGTDLNVMSDAEFKHKASDVIANKVASILSLELNLELPVEALIKSFKNGEELWNTDATFRATIETLLNNRSGFHVLESLLTTIREQQKEIAELRLSTPSLGKIMMTGTGSGAKSINDNDYDYRSFYTKHSGA